MDDAQTLFREGVLALRERKDVAAARRLISQSLKLNPENEMAWLWLARTTSDPDKRRACVERALRINPNNEQALALQAKLDSASNGRRGGAVAAVVATAAVPRSPAEAGKILSPKQEMQIDRLLAVAEKKLAADDVEGAIENWVRVLRIQVDHPEAMRLAVRHLSRLKYLDDAHELLHRAINAGTTDPGIYLTAIDIARVQHDYVEMDALGEQLARLPEAGDEAVLVVVDQLIKGDQPLRAMEVIDIGLTTHPTSQALMTRKGDLYTLMDQLDEARHWYDQAARLGAGTKAGREADKKLGEYAPVLTDRERGSVMLAWREALGFSVFFIFLAWQDAGLDLLALGPMRLLGVAAGTIGGYLLVTATSSAQQQPLTRLFGGEVPELAEGETALLILPPAYRAVMGVIGALVLVVAFWLVFNMSFGLLLEPVSPPDVPTFDEIFYGG